MALSIDDQCVIVLCLLPGHQQTVEKEDKQAHSNQTEDEALRSLVVVPLVPLPMVHEHQVGDRQVHENGGEQKPFVHFEIVKLDALLHRPVAECE